MVKSNSDASETPTELPLQNRSERTGRISTSCKRQRDAVTTTGSFGRRTGDSDLLFLEGILPEANGTVLSDHSIEDQTAACLDRLESILGSRDVPLADVMKVEIRLTDPAARDAVDDVYGSRFREAYPPRSVVGVSWLPGGAALQLDVVAADE